jgi:hypothetical protein
LRCGTIVALRDVLLRGVPQRVGHRRLAARRRGATCQRERNNKQQ